MPIDPSIALGVKPIQFESPINQMAKMYEMQNMQQSNQLNQMKMSDLQRAAAKEENLNALVGGFTPDMNDTDKYNALLRGGHFAEAKAFNESAAKANADKRAAESARLDNLTKVHGIFKTTMNGIIGNPTLANAINTVRKTGVLLGEDTADDEAELMAFGENPTAIREWATRHAIEADKLLGKPGQRDIGGSIQDTMVDPITGKVTVLGTTVKTPTPGEQKPTFNQGAWYYPPTAENPQGVRVGQPQGEMPKLKPGEVWDATKQTVKQVPGSAEYNKQSKIHGTDYNAAKTVVSKMDNAIKKVNEILKPENASGFENNFGGYNAAASRMFSGNTATVRKDIDTLKADMKGAGLELIRAGGSIGALTEREWPMLEAQIDAIDYMLDEPAAKKAFERVKTTFERIKDQAKDTYQTTWGETQYYKPDVLKGGLPPPPPADAVKLTPEQKKKYDALKAKHG